MMSDQGEHPPEEMQFDRAEYAGEAVASGPACGLCHREIEGEYYEANGLLLCSPCRQAVGAAIAGGSGIARFLRAAVFGFGAAVAGFAIYFGVMKVTGYEIGLISIVVGLMVGGAVRKGSNGRGGWAYQLLAMFLVYTAVVASYGANLVPALIAEFNKPRAGKDQPAGNKPPEVVAAPKEKPAPVREVGPLAMLGQIALFLVFMTGFLYALPVLVGMQQPMGLLIIGFALWEAWKINRKVSLVFNGPYRVGEGGGLAAGGVPGHA